ncbi:COX15/CtaA family protein [Methylocaldum szegediense]|jgi:cytochrome c oxidase assembly protein subunit 15|uniref:Cytochrome c oxidase assembly protein subunit 15 n=1 Tax=Methylocaldum szegediense TaxID=73780 RepID=A0ABM9I6F6_9GAMM|nr:COX15/CtaA family protein [Methylocaldum szegediense]CAI8921912.1 cytochrome c oxidase assembly protein subunit 15 [Methylocaldum szegediense]
MNDTVSSAFEPQHAFPSNPSDAAISRRFRRIGLITIAAVYFLILVGGIVRASGAGMGCPDWPTCFGRWIPPTDESQLPPNYHEIYAERGYADTEFNPVKTWTEYVNRLVGVSIGVLVLLTLLYSVPYLKRDRTVFFLALLVFLLVGFQGWLGSAVVASNLRPIMITAHMVMAFVIVCLLIYTIARSQQDTLCRLDSGALSPKFKTVLAAAMGMTLLQIMMGTQIRESVDIIASTFNQAERHLWREEFPTIFYIHRSFSAVILFTNLWLVWHLVQRLHRRHLLRSFAIGLGALVVAAIGTGVTLDRLGFPAFVQPIHLVLANLIFGAQFFLFIALRYSERPTITGVARMG